jgi:hypothetical protein
MQSSLFLIQFRATLRRTQRDFPSPAAGCKPVAGHAVGEFQVRDRGGVGWGDENISGLARSRLRFCSPIVGAPQLPRTGLSSS